MTAPNSDESQQFNEPRLLEADGFLNRAWRRLGEALGPFVAEKTGKDSFKDTRDVHAILSEMDSTWNTHFRTVGRDERDRGPRSWVVDLLNFRNGPWAHQVGYDDRDVLKCLYQIWQLLRVVSADKQAQAVEQMYDELGKLLFSGAQPTPNWEASELTEPQQLVAMLSRMTIQQFSELQTGMSRIRGQLDGGGSTSGPTPSFINDAVHSATPIGPTTDEDVPSNARSISLGAAEDFLRMGNENRLGGFIDDAMTNYSRAIELNPLLVGAYVGRGNAYMDGEEYESAISDYSSALKLNQGDASAYFYRGFAYAGQCKYGQAISDYSDALRLNPGGALAIAAYGNRGNAYRAQDEHDLALADYDSSPSS